MRLPTKWRKATAWPSSPAPCGFPRQASSQRIPFSWRHPSLCCSQESIKSHVVTAAKQLERLTRVTDWTASPSEMFSASLSVTENPLPVVVRGGYHPPKPHPLQNTLSSVPSVTGILHTCPHAVSSIHFLTHSPHHQEWLRNSGPGDRNTHFTSLHHMFRPASQVPSQPGKVHSVTFIQENQWPDH